MRKTNWPVVVLMLLAGVSVLATADIILLSPLGAGYEAMRVDLSRLAGVEESYYKEHKEFLPPGMTMNPLGKVPPVGFHGFMPTPGVLIRVGRTADGQGWWAVAVHQEERGECVIFAGTPEEVPPATEDNVSACTKRRR